MNDRDEELESLRHAWGAIAPATDESDPATLAIVASLRTTWRTLPIPPTVRRLPRPRQALRRFVPLAAALALATFALQRAGTDVRPSVAHVDVLAPSPSANAEWRLVADLTLATLGGAPRTAWLPAFCLCCEALLLSDSARSWPVAPSGEPDAAIAAAIAADCRGDWSDAVSILEPTLARELLTAEQRIRASAALSHAYRQLGRIDDAARAEAVLLAAN